MKINSKMYSYLKQLNSKEPPPPPSYVTYGREKDLIDLSDPPDLIDFGDEEPADLIDFSTEIPNPPPPPPKGKKCNLINEDLIPTSSTSSSANGSNILNNILKYPERKNILGISLTADLKQKIKSLDSGASFGIANIISSLISANRGKMSAHSISRNQLKEIVEGLITTISVLLSPAQKT